MSSFPARSTQSFLLLLSGLLSQIRSARCDTFHLINLQPSIMVLEAGYPNTTGFRKVVKVTVMIKKKEGMSDEDFINHYNNVHAQMAAPVVQRAGAISYSLVILPLRSYYAIANVSPVFLVLNCNFADVPSPTRPQNDSRHPP